MSRVTQDANIDRVIDPKEQIKFISIFMDQVQQCINNGLLFSDNFDANILNITFTAVDTNTTFEHSLDRIPTGYFEIRKSAAMILYDGLSPWTPTSISLRSSVVGTATVVVF